MKKTPPRPTTTHAGIIMMKLLILAVAVVSTSALPTHAQVAS